MKRERTLAAWAACTLLALTISAPVKAEQNYAASLRELQATDARVHSIGWRLARGNVQSCAETRPAIGLLIQDVMGYNRPEAARSALALPVDFAVQAVAEGSPAARAELSANQPLIAINGHDLSEMVEDAKAPFLRLLSVERALQHSLDTDGRVELKMAGKAGVVSIAGEQICRVRFIVRPRNKDAVADAEAVYIGGKFVGLSYSEDELAAAMAHETAHVLLHHPQWLSENGRKRRHVRRTEREADRLMPWLLHNAGYDPQAAVRFMQRWGSKHDGGLFRRRTHDGWDERVKLIEAELVALHNVVAETGSADWSQHFRRQQR